MCMENYSFALRKFWLKFHNDNEMNYRLNMHNNFWRRIPSLDFPVLSLHYAKSSCSWKAIRKACLNDTYICAENGWFIFLP
jgi:hypothetical protein